jgi:DNA invertase Pin-like site-specific DNA recombinase
MTTAKRVALYARVSTANHGQDPKMQTNELTEYCAQRGWEIAAEYVDIGISGTKEKRPELDLMMLEASKGRFDVVAVWRFDRFARSTSHLLKALETFKKLGIEFVSLREQIDTSTPTGKMIFTVLGAVAELERSLIIERVRSGLRNARAKGKTLGKPKRDDVDVDKIKKLRAGGMSWRGISQRVGVPVSTCRERCAENPNDLALCG